ILSQLREMSRRKPKPIGKTFYVSLRAPERGGLKMTHKTSYRLALVCVATFLLAVTGWAKVYTMQATPLVPGAVGTVDARADKNGGNTQVTLKAEHLAKPTL